VVTCDSLASIPDGIVVPVRKMLVDPQRRGVVLVVDDTIFTHDFTYSSDSFSCVSVASMSITNTMPGSVSVLKAETMA
jgi:hypothetical protein